MTDKRSPGRPMAKEYKTMGIGSLPETGLAGEVHYSSPRIAFDFVGYIPCSKSILRKYDLCNILRNTNISTQHTGH